MNASPEQICSEFSQYFFNGVLTETRDNSDDITLLLTMSADICVGQGFSIFNDAVSTGGRMEILPLTDYLVLDIAPDRRGYAYKKLEPIQFAKRQQK